MQTNGQSNGYHRPFPALTPAQRLHLDVYGYVIIENTLTADEVGRLREALQKLKRDLIATGDPANAVVRGARFSTYKPHHVHFAHILETDPAILGYLTHPRLVAMAEEFVGGAVRLEESEGIINSRPPDYDPSAPVRYGFHTGTRPDLGTYTENGLFHCNFVKTLTNLTEALRGQGKRAEARRVCEDALTLARSLGHVRGEGLQLKILGEMASEEGDFATAVTCFEQALTAARAQGDRYYEAERLYSLGQALRHLGNGPAAHDCLTEALTVARQVNDEATEGKVLAELELLVEMPEREVAVIA